MCGRVIQASGPDQLGLKIVGGPDDRDSRLGNFPPRYNGAPSQDFWVVRRNPKTGERTLDLLRWGLIPSWSTAKPKPAPPINAKAESVHKAPMFREAYARRRCILPVDGFFEWRAVKGTKLKQPYAIAMKDRSPFGLAGVWENWKDPDKGEWVRTFCVVTTDANELVATIHDRMPVILAPGDYERWLGDDPDPRDLLRTFLAEPMTMWPVSTRVNSPKNDDAELIEPAIEVDANAPPDGNSA